MSTTASSSPPHRITSDVLNKFYPNVKHLRGYLSDLLESSEAQFNLVNETDAQSYQELVNLSLVGVKELTHKKFPFHPPMLEMREVSCQHKINKFLTQRSFEKLLDQAQERLFQCKYPQNIITSGYRRVSASHYFIVETA